MFLLDNEEEVLSIDKKSVSDIRSYIQGITQNQFTSKRWIFMISAVRIKLIADEMLDSKDSMNEK